MGQVASGISETFGAAASGLTKSFSSMITEPKRPLEMPNLGDGRTQDQLRTTAEMMYNMDTKQHINIAFIGTNNNENKLSVINSCRFIADCKPVLGIDAPKKVATCYLHCDPAYKHVRFWDITDMPGTYEMKCLFAFDAIVILIGEQIRSSDIDLVKQANIISSQCPVLLVRPDMNTFIDKELNLEPNSTHVVAGKTRQGPILKQGYACQLKNAGIQCERQCHNVYLISPPGMLAARGVNAEGTKYIWDEFDFMKGLLDCVTSRRY